MRILDELLQAIGAIGVGPFLNRALLCDVQQERGGSTGDGNEPAALFIKTRTHGTKNVKRVWTFRWIGTRIGRTFAAALRTSDRLKGRMIKNHEHTFVLEGLLLSRQLFLGGSTEAYAVGNDGLFAPVAEHRIENVP